MLLMLQVTVSNYNRLVECGLAPKDVSCLPYFRERHFFLLEKLNYARTHDWVGLFPPEGASDATCPDCDADCCECVCDKCKLPFSASSSLDSKKVGG